MNINIQEFGGTIAALLVVGTILKNAFPAFPNRLIPLVTWVLGVLAYLALSKGWGDPQQWIAAVVAAATATGVHSGIKNTMGDGKPPAVLLLLLLGVCAWCLTGCTNGAAAVARALAKDPATVSVKINSIYGTASVVRVGGADQ